jgi:hypothetical protein
MPSENRAKNIAEFLNRESIPAFFQSGSRFRFARTLKHSIQTAQFFRFFRLP